MSDRPTPMTDALLLRINEGRVYKDEGPMEVHARDLERKLAAVTKERDTLKRMIEEGITFQDIAETKPDAP